METQSIVRNKLDKYQTNKLCRYIEDNHESFNYRTSAEIAMEATEKLLFTVTRKNLASAAEGIRISWKKAHRVSGNTQALQDVNQQLQYLAEAMLAVFRDVGIDVHKTSPKAAKYLYKTAGRSVTENCEINFSGDDKQTR